MKHLLEWASKEKNINYDYVLNSSENPRVINCLFDVGTRHRQTGKSTAIAELAVDKAVKNPLKEIVVIVASYKSIEHMSKKINEAMSKTMLGILCQPTVRIKTINGVKEFISYCEEINKQVIVLTDDCNLNKLLPEWNSECIVEKFGWWVPEFNKE